MNVTLLKSGAERLKIALDEQKIEQMSAYAAFLKEYNKKVNLTAILDDDGITVKHFLDSLTLLTVLNIPRGARVIDVGTGAGFPGVVAKIVRPDIELTLLDSNQKKIVFLNELTEKLGLNANTLHSRAEDAGRQEDLRERFDIVTARAVAHLRELAEYCLPLLRPGGYFAAMKGPAGEEELQAAQHAITELGGAVESIEKLILPQGQERRIVLMKKISQTPTMYPRPSAKIAKRPLE